MTFKGLKIGEDGMIEKVGRRKTYGRSSRNRIQGMIITSIAFLSILSSQSLFSWQHRSLEIGNSCFKQKNWNIQEKYLLK